MKSALFLLLFFSIPLLAQTDSVKLQAKLQTIQNLYEYGDYASCISEGKLLLKSKPEFYTHCQVQLLLSRAHFATLSFRESYALSSAMDSLCKSATGNQKLFTLEQLATHSFLLNDIASSKLYLSQIEKGKRSVALKLLETELCLARGETTYANALLNELSVLSEAGKLSFEEKILLDNLQDLFLVKNGNYAEALKSLQAHQAKGQSDKTIPATVLSRSYQINAELHLRRENYAEARRCIKLAYATLVVSDYHQDKILLLTQMAMLSKFVGDQTEYDQYLRRLQLHADRSIYKYNYYQLGNLFARHYAHYVDLNYSRFESGVTSLLAKYPEMPAYHVFRNLIAEVQFTSLKEQVKCQASNLDTLRYSRRRTLGEEAPEVELIAMARWSSEISSGKRMKEVRAELVALTEKHSESVLATSFFYWRIANLQAALEFAEDHYKTAFVISGKTVSLSDSLFGKESKEALLCRLNHAEYAYWAGDYRIGLEVLKNAEQVAQWVEKENHQECKQWVYAKLAHLADLLGDDLQWKKFTARILRRTGAQGLRSLDAEARVLLESGNYFEKNINLFLSGRLYQKSQQLSSLYDEGSSAQLNALGGLASVSILDGNFSESEKYSASYEKISKENSGDVSMAYANALKLRAGYYLAIGDLNRSRELLLACIVIQKNILGEYHLSLAHSYLMLARVESQSGNLSFEKIEPIFLQAGSSIDKSIGKNNLMYARFLVEFSGFLISGKRYELARTNLEEANQYLMLHKTPLLHAELTMQQGHLEYALERYPAALRQYEGASNEYASIFNKKHPSYCQAVSFESRGLYMMGQTSESLKRLQVIIPVYLEFIDLYFPTMSFEEKNKFWSSMKEQFEFYNFLCLSGTENTATLNGTVYNNIISTKALLLASDIKLRKQIAQSGDTLLIRLFSDWIIQKQLLTSLMSTSKEELTEEKIDLNALKQELEKLEKSIMARSQAFQNTVKKKRCTWQEVKSSLGLQEYAVEIIRYRAFNKTFTDSIIYAGLVLTSTSEAPMKVIMGDGKRMDNRYYKYYKNSMQFSEKDEFSYAVYWKSIKSLIPDKALIYLSSDGVYNQLNCETFFNATTGKNVFDENALVQITNTKDLVAEELAQNTVQAPIVLSGNPTFYSSSSSAVHTISALPGAEKEVQHIKSILDAYGKKSMLLMNEQVTEDTLMQFRSPQVLHIATHGYFADMRKLNGDFAANPLLYSGILLKDAGDILSSSGYAYVNSQSGVLTAYEAINMYLDNTEMVVLSACETGKGEVQAGEGVMGLQRAFLVAGAQCIVVAMVKVNDEVTNELMQQFYKNWQEGLSKREAFQKAKIHVKDKFKEPKYWGAFVMIEGKVEKRKLKP